MKCIQYHRQHGGHVARVTDEEADSAVRRDIAIFAPKHWWKAAKLSEEQPNDT